MRPRWESARTPDSRRTPEASARLRRRRCQPTRHPGARFRTGTRRLRASRRSGGTHDGCTDGSPTGGTHLARSSPQVAWPRNQGRSRPPRAAPTAGCNRGRPGRDLELGRGPGEGSGRVAGEGGIPQFPLPGQDKGPRGRGRAPVPRLQPGRTRTGQSSGPRPPQGSRGAGGSRTPPGLMERPAGRAARDPGQGWKRSGGRGPRGTSWCFRR